MKLDEAMGMSAIFDDTSQLISALGQYLENHMDYLPEETRGSVARAYRELKELRADLQER